MWTHPTMQQSTVRFYLGSLTLLTVQSSMGLTQLTWTCHTQLSPLRLAQQETLSVWYWGSDWTLQLNTTTLCLQLVVMSLWQCKGPSQHHSIVSVYYRSPSLITAVTNNFLVMPICIAVKKSVAWKSSDFMRCSEGWHSFCIFFWKEGGW